MITGDVKSKVDRMWDTMWSGGISNPLAITDADLERAEEEIVRLLREVTT